MSLRLQINLLVVAIALTMLAAVMGFHLRATRVSVHEEVDAANRVALQFLAQLRGAGGTRGVEAVEPVVRDLGRIRSNEIEIVDASGGLRYRSPPSLYKAGRTAPRWFARLIAPPDVERSIDLADGRLLVRTDASRAVLDGWDELSTILAIGGLLVLAASVAVYASMRRILAPIAEVVEGLHQAQSGRFDFRAAERGGTEARVLAAAFNRLMRAVGERDAAQRRVTEAEEQRDLSRELALRFERELESERRALARDLHDDLGQHATALKTLAATLERRLGADEPSLARLASLMVRSADALFAALRAMINRVRPEALERGGLVDGLRSLVDDWRLRRPGTRMELLLEPADERAFGLGVPEVEAAAYRIVQEAITNAVRHARASLVVVSARSEAGALTLQVSDDGPGFDAERIDAGLGLRGMRERTDALGGRFSIGRGEAGGTELLAVLPWPGPRGQG